MRIASEFMQVTDFSFDTYLNIFISLSDKITIILVSFLAYLFGRVFLNTPPPASIKIPSSLSLGSLIFLEM